MLDGLKRLLRRPAAAAADWSAVEPWARAAGRGYREVHGEGFVVDSRQGDAAWRLEWGPSQRPYVTGNELRLRAELGLSPDLQIVVMNRALQEQMERDVFDQYVEGVQTRIDDQTPPEMRWLVMFPKLAGADVPPLRERFVVVASVRPWAMSWLQGALARALASHRAEPQQPLVLMVGRGRVVLRTALDDPDPVELDRWLRLFDTAVREARRAVAEDLLPPDDAVGEGAVAD